MSETLTGVVQMEIVDYGMYVNEAQALLVCMSFEARAFFEAREPKRHHNTLSRGCSQLYF